MKESFQHVPERFRGNWESEISHAKHSLGVCYMKLKLSDESEKYLREDLHYCERKRMSSALNTQYASPRSVRNRAYFHACVEEGQTHISLGWVAGTFSRLGNLYLHAHTPAGYQQAKLHYEKALSLFQSVASHIDESFVKDARQNLFVLEEMKQKMARFLELVKTAENCGSEEERYKTWRECCEEVLRLEQYENETPFKALQNSAELVYGKSSFEFADSLHLYAEYLYVLYSGNEDPTKLNQSKAFCETSIAILRSTEQPNELASVLELYGSVLSAIHDVNNDQVAGSVVRHS